jgi:hypothetical protein
MYNNFGLRVKIAIEEKCVKHHKNTVVIVSYFAAHIYLVILFCLEAKMKSSSK